MILVDLKMKVINVLWMAISGTCITIQVDEVVQMLIKNYVMLLMMKLIEFIKVDSIVIHL